MISLSLIPAFIARESALRNAAGPINSCYLDLTFVIFEFWSGI